MDGNDSNHQNQVVGGNNVNINRQSNLDDQRARLQQYTFPGTLHYLQYEWARFEMDRSQWELEKAELEAKIAFITGERNGQENLKKDLVRRIKMLEFALKQERIKFHKLKYGENSDTCPIADPAPSLLDELGGDGIDGADPGANNALGNNSASFKQSRDLLKQYLQEIGYTDTIIDIRSNRVRSLLGLVGNEGEEDGSSISGPNNSSDPASTKRPADPTTIRWNQPKKSMTSLEAQIKDAEKAVLDNFDFLAAEAGDMEVDDEEEDSSKAAQQQQLDGDEEGVESLDQEFRYMPGNAIEDEGQNFTSSRRVFSGGVEEDAIEGLGELAQLTVSNEADNNYDLATNKESYRKTWTAKYTLRSHFDGVRGLCFHPTEQALITASEDATLKLWNLQKTVPAKKTPALDVEPVYTFRGHMGSVLCLAMTQDGERCFSAGIDTNIRIWNVPSINVDPYDSYDSNVDLGVLSGHTDCVWSLKCRRNQLLSASADGTVKLWQPNLRQTNTAANTYHLAKDGVVTDVDFVFESSDQLVASFDNGACIIFDMETGKAVTRLETESLDNNAAQVNKVVSHPTLGITITAHEDRHIRFWENASGRLLSSMVAHLDAVTSLALDTSGLYLLSGSHDCSIRLWHVETKQCLQEITAHRKKFDESIFDVAFHPSMAFIASAGADALAKVFVC